MFIDKYIFKKTESANQEYKQKYLKILVPVQQQPIHRQEEKSPTKAANKSEKLP